MTEQQVSPTKRTALIKLLWSGAAAFAAAICYPIFAYLRPPAVSGEKVSSVLVGSVDDFDLGSGVHFRFGNEPGLLVRLEDGSFKAFSATCTHLDCTVQYREDMGLIWCACHNGKFDLRGRNIAGPPPRPLDEFEVHIQGGEVHVKQS
jgi:cytochrome b6-f complex iron-sulfur subunit